MTFPNFPHRLAGRAEQCTRSWSQSPFSPGLRPQAWPELPLSRVHVCTSAPWFLQNSAVSCTGQGKRKWQSQQRIRTEPINFLICGWENRSLTKSSFLTGSDFPSHRAPRATVEGGEKLFGCKRAFYHVKEGWVFGLLVQSIFVATPLYFL